MPSFSKHSRLSFKHLQTSDLQRLEHLRFVPRRVIEGRYSGHFTTRQRGQSVEFRDYRDYLPGDDVGKVDWKVYGRSDKLFIKLFEHHSELTVPMIVDASASMGYRGVSWENDRSLSKYDYACTMAASIAFLIMKQHDRFGLALAQKGLKHWLPPDRSMSHLIDILKRMQQTRPWGAARLSDTLHALNRQGSQRNLLLVFSDLWDEADEVARALAARVHAGGEVILFHVLHPHELQLPDMEHGVFVDSETGGRIRLDVSEVRETYQQKVREHLDRWSRRCSRMSVDYLRVMTSQPYYKVLERYVAGRATVGQ